MLRYMSLLVIAALFVRFASSENFEATCGSVHDTVLASCRPFLSIMSGPAIPQAARHHTLSVVSAVLERNATTASWPPMPNAPLPLRDYVNTNSSLPLYFLKAPAVCESTHQWRISPAASLEHPRCKGYSDVEAVLDELGTFSTEFGDAETGPLHNLMRYHNDGFTSFVPDRCTLRRALTTVAVSLVHMSRIRSGLGSPSGVSFDQCTSELARTLAKVLLPACTSAELGIGSNASYRVSQTPLVACQDSDTVWNASSAGGSSYPSWEKLTANNAAGFFIFNNVRGVIGQSPAVAIVALSWVIIGTFVVGFLVLWIAVAVSTRFLRPPHRFAFEISCGSAFIRFASRAVALRFESLPAGSILFALVACLWCVFIVSLSFSQFESFRGHHIPVPAIGPTGSSSPSLEGLHNHFGGAFSIIHFVFTAATHGIPIASVESAMSQYGFAVSNARSTVLDSAVFFAAADLQERLNNFSFDAGNATIDWTSTCYSRRSIASDARFCAVKQPTWLMGLSGRTLTFGLPALLATEIDARSMINTSDVVTTSLSREDATTRIVRSFFQRVLTAADFSTFQSGMLSGNWFVDFTDDVPHSNDSLDNEFILKRLRALSPLVLPTALVLSYPLDVTSLVADTNESAAAILTSATQSLLELQSHEGIHTVVSQGQMFDSLDIPSSYFKSVWALLFVVPSPLMLLCLCQHPRARLRVLLRHGVTIISTATITSVIVTFSSLHLRFLSPNSVAAPAIALLLPLWFMALVLPGAFIVIWMVPISREMRVQNPPIQSKEGDSQLRSETRIVESVPSSPVGVGHQQHAGNPLPLGNASFWPASHGVNAFGRTNASAAVGDSASTAQLRGTQSAAHTGSSDGGVELPFTARNTFISCRRSCTVVISSYIPVLLGFGIAGSVSFFSDRQISLMLLETFVLLLVCVTTMIFLHLIGPFLFNMRPVTHTSASVQPRSRSLSTKVSSPRVSALSINLPVSVSLRTGDQVAETMSTSTSRSQIGFDRVDSGGGHPIRDFRVDTVSIATSRSQPSVDHRDGGFRDGRRPETLVVSSSLGSPLQLPPLADHRVEFLSATTLEDAHVEDRSDHEGHAVRSDVGSPTVKSGDDRDGGEFNSGGADFHDGERSPTRSSIRVNRLIRSRRGSKKTVINEHRSADMGSLSHQSSSISAVHTTIDSKSVMIISGHSLHSASGPPKLTMHALHEQDRDGNFAIFASQASIHRTSVSGEQQFVGLTPNPFKTDNFAGVLDRALLRTLSSVFYSPMRRQLFAGACFVMIILLLCAIPYLASSDSETLPFSSYVPARNLHAFWMDHELDYPMTFVTLQPYDFSNPVLQRSYLHAFHRLERLGIVSHEIHLWLAAFRRDLVTAFCTHSPGEDNIDCPVYSIHETATNASCRTVATFARGSLFSVSDGCVIERSVFGAFLRQWLTPTIVTDTDDYFTGYGQRFKNDIVWSSSNRSIVTVRFLGMWRGIPGSATALRQVEAMLLWSELIAGPVDSAVLPLKIGVESFLFMFAPRNQSTYLIFTFALICLFIIPVGISVAGDLLGTLSSVSVIIFAALLHAVGCKVAGLDNSVVSTIHYIFACSTSAICECILLSATRRGNFPSHGVITLDAARLFLLPIVTAEVAGALICGLLLTFVDIPLVRCTFLSLIFSHVIVIVQVMFIRSSVRIFLPGSLPLSGIKIPRFHGNAPMWFTMYLTAPAKEADVVTVAAVHDIASRSPSLPSVFTLPNRKGPEHFGSWGSLPVGAEAGTSEHHVPHPPIDTESLVSSLWDQ